MWEAWVWIGVARSISDRLNFPQNKRVRTPFRSATSCLSNTAAFPTRTLETITFFVSFDGTLIGGSCCCWTFVYVSARILFDVTRTCRAGMLCRVPTPACENICINHLIYNERILLFQKWPCILRPTFRVWHVEYFIKYQPMQLHKCLLKLDRTHYASVNERRSDPFIVFASKECVFVCGIRLW